MTSPLTINRTEITPSYLVSEGSEKDLVFSSLEERLREAFVTSSVETQKDYATIISNLNNVSYVTKPEGLLDLQMRLGEYQQKVETVLALTRKGVSTIETVLRA